jgi:zinc protease
VAIRNRIIGAGVVLVLGCAGVAVAQEKPSADPIPVRRTVLADPAIRSGVLPNGMRYFIMRAALPANGLSLRLGIDTGSFEEAETERGYAHLVEHMAFRATRSAPDGGLDRRFGALGVAFGRDQNAQTAVFATTYKLDFGKADEQGVDEGFRWLRDVADGVVFPAPAVATERNVVLAERQSRESPETKAGEAVGRFNTPEMRAVNRLPGGTPEALAAAMPDTLRAFYDRWYRPEHAVLVAVGDQPVEALEARVKASFSTWQGKGDRPTRAPFGKVDLSRGLDTFSTVAPGMATIVSACRVQPPLPRDTSEIDRTTREARNAIWQAVLAERFKSLVNAGNSGLVGAAIVDNSQREYAGTCLIVVPSGEKWEKGLAAAQAELRRFAKDGPTERELEVQLEAGRGALRGAISLADGRLGPALADTILARAADWRTTPSPREAMHAYDVAVEGLDPAGVKASFAAAWSGAGPLVTLVMPKPVDREAIRAAWIRAEGGAALAAFSDRKKLAWAYTDFGTATAVVQREEIKVPGFIRLRFGNGVILNFKHSTLEKNEVELRARFGAGRREIANKDLLAATLGAGLLSAGGLGRLSAEEMEASLQGVGWDVKLQLGNEAFDFVSSTTQANLQTQLQVFAAFMTDPGFRPVIDERLPDAIDIMSRMYRSSPGAVLADAFVAAVDPGNPEVLPARATMDAWRSADFARVLKPALVSAPIELTIVGDIEEAAAIRLVADTFGALPPRQKTDRALPDTHFLRFADRPIPVIRATHEGPADRAVARLVWPLYVATPERRAEEYALKLAAAVFDTELRQRIRTDLGKSYSPQVLTQMPDHADQGVLLAQIEGSPTDLDSLVAEAQIVARKIASGGITAEALEAARRPTLAQMASLRGRNVWWAGALDGSAANPALIEEAMGFEPLMSSITVDQVNAAAAKWLAPAPIVAIAAPIAGVGSDAAAPAAGGAAKSRKGGGR